MGGRTSSPRQAIRSSNGGVIDSYTLQLVNKPTTEDPGETGGVPLRQIGNYAAPDDLFSQCGIQFRLEAYMAIEVPQEIYQGDVGEAMEALIEISKQQEWTNLITGLTEVGAVQFVLMTNTEAEVSFSTIYASPAR